MAPVSAQDEIGLDDVLGRASAYVAAYVDDLSNVVMEEDYRQIYYPGRYGLRRVKTPSRERGLSPGSGKKAGVTARRSGR